MLLLLGQQVSPGAVPGQGGHKVTPLAQLEEGGGPCHTTHVLASPSELRLGSEVLGPGSDQRQSTEVHFAFAPESKVWGDL